MSSRHIRRAVNQSRSAVADLLQTVFVAELNSPGEQILLFSPWVSDFPLIDNRAGRFSHIDAQWPAAQIRLSAVLRTLLRRDVELLLAFRPEEREKEFLQRLGEMAADDGTADKLVLRPGIPKDQTKNHEKALIAETWALHGSMNFTYSGVEINGELVTFTTDPAEVAALSVEFRTEFEVRP